MTKKKLLQPLLKIRSLFPKKLATLTSSYNSQIVVMSYANGPCVWVNGIQQSGPYIEKLWNHVLASIDSSKAKTILILGFGSGSVYRALRATNHDATIIGVDIDPVMVQIGKDYFGLPSSDRLTVLIGDAQKVMAQQTKQFDLVIIDLFFGSEMQLSRTLLIQAATHLAKEGKIIINSFNGTLPKVDLKVIKTLTFKKNAITILTS